MLAPETVNGSFAISTKTKTEQVFTGTASTGNRINVSSTLGWGSIGSFLIGTETITFSSKTVTQFILMKDKLQEQSIILLVLQFINQ